MAALSAPNSRSSLRVFIPDGNFPDGNYNHTLMVTRCLVRGSIADDVAVHVGVGAEVPRALRLSRHVAGIHPLPQAADEPAFGRAVVEVANRIGADVVLPISQDGHRLVAQVRHRFGDGIALVPLSDGPTLQVARDKGRLIAFMRAHGIPHPPAIPLAPRATLPERLRGLSFPVLVKATRSKGGKHIFRCDEAAEVVRWARTRPEDRDYVVQSFVAGTDVCYCVLAEEGQVQAYTIQQDIAPPAAPFAPLEFIRFVHDDRVEAVGRALVEALGFSGMACIDLRYNADRSSVAVLEINPRVWGSLLGSLRAGVNFPDLACRVALGLPIDVTPYTTTEYSVGEVGLKHVWRTVRRGIPLRDSCMAYGLDDPLPDLAEFARMKLQRLTG